MWSQPVIVYVYEFVATLWLFILLLQLTLQNIIIIINIIAVSHSFPEPVTQPASQPVNQPISQPSHHFVGESGQAGETPHITCHCDRQAKRHLHILCCWSWNHSWLFICWRCWRDDERWLWLLWPGDAIPLISTKKLNNLAERFILSPSSS